MLDMHCHILPGVDDGAKDWNVTKAMMAKAAQCGIKHIVATPHVLKPHQDISNIRAVYPQARDMARQMGLKLSLGYEVNWRVLLDTPVREFERYCILGTNSMLLELPNRSPFPGLDRVLARMHELYNLIIVHPERFRYVQKNVAYIEEIMAYGCEISVDTSGLYSKPFSEERAAAKSLYKQEMVHYLASDAHCVADYSYFQKAKKHIENLNVGVLYDAAYWDKV